MTKILKGKYIVILLIFLLEILIMYITISNILTKDLICPSC